MWVMSGGMARQLKVDLIDDIDGVGPAVETVRFGVDGNEYDIDLNAAHAAELRQILAPYRAVARRAGSMGRTSRPARWGTRQELPAAGATKAAMIRAWAERAGIPVNPKGRIRNDIVQEWERATQGKV